DRIDLDVTARQHARQHFRQLMALCDRKRQRRAARVEPVAPQLVRERTLHAKKGARRFGRKCGSSKRHGSVCVAGGTHARQEKQRSRRKKRRTAERRCSPISLNTPSFPKIKPAVSSIPQTCCNAVWESPATIRQRAFGAEGTTDVALDLHRAR